jgi:hypothetical protein
MRFRLSNEIALTLLDTLAHPARRELDFHQVTRLDGATLARCDLRAYDVTPQV